ncbi:MAG: DUF4783 domain-containing protein [Flammeovirgaceae bacterium]|nr:DUF4783 domain-containing protein [Flammeovirgaceae bacterium]
MKTYNYTLLALFILLISSQGFAQVEVMANAQVAIKAGNVESLVKHFNESVELNFIDEKKNYSKTQAEFVLKDFFSKYPAVDFQYDHKTTSRGGLKFTIGTYTHKGGKFRVHMLIKQSEGKYIIDLLDFTEE